MKKLLIHLVKYINHFTNTTVTAQQDADSLYSCMIYKNDPLRTLKVFEALEARVKYEMLQEEKKASAICRAINGKYTREPKVYNPDFDKSFKELEVKFN